MISQDLQPQRYARIGGALYFFVIVAAMFGESIVRGTLIVSGDAAATAEKILAQESLFRMGIAAELLTCVCDVALALILYVLLRPVGKNLALLGAWFRLVFAAVYSVAKLFEVAALILLTNSALSVSLDPKQRQSLAYAFLKLHDLSYGASLLFFGCCTLCFGYLIYISMYLPKVLGTVLIAAGVGYVLFSLAQVLAPSFASQWLFPWLLLPGFFGELGLALWLLIRGVDTVKWSQHARSLG